MRRSLKAVFRLPAKIHFELIQIKTGQTVKWINNVAKSIWTLAIQCGKSALRVVFENKIWCESDLPAVKTQPKYEVASCSKQRINRQTKTSHANWIVQLKRFVVVSFPCSGFG